MFLQPSERLTRYQNHWCLDLRFRKKSELVGAEKIFCYLVETWSHRLACTLDTEQLQRKNRVDRRLKGPLLMINDVAYIRYGSGTGQIGFFLDEHPDFSIEDPQPYEPHLPYMDDVESLYLAQAFTQEPEVKSYRTDYRYHWRGQVYWIGEHDTDLELHVFTRRAKSIVAPRLVQGRMF